MIDFLTHWAHIIVIGVCAAYIGVECVLAERKNR